jgi:uncharacterized delta-60 repeat protein
MKILQLIFYACAITSNCFAQILVPDSNFGNEGLLTFKNSSYVNNVTALPDGRILFLGNYTFGNGINGVALFMVDSNGKLDSTFSEDGILPDTVRENKYGPHGFLHVQPDGRIYSGTLNTNACHFSCFWPDGTYNLEFGKEGILKIDTFEYVWRGLPICFSSNPDNSFIIGLNGHSTLDGSKTFAYSLVKFTSTGKVDVSFGRNGYVAFNFSDWRFVLNACHILKDGSIICLGSDYSLTDNARTSLIKLSPNGSVDKDFGLNGKSTIDVNIDEYPNIHWEPYLETAGSLVEYNDGKLLLTSLSDRNLLDHVLRLMPDGKVDSTFCSNGISEGVTGIVGLEVQSDGRIIIGNKGGFTFINNNKIDSYLLSGTNSTIDCFTLQSDSAIIQCSSTITDKVWSSSIVRLLLNNQTVDFVNPTIKNDLIIYPIPFKDVLNFQSTQATIREVFIYDLKGRCILYKKVNQMNLELKMMLPKGIYLCKVVTSNGVNLYKLEASSVAR